jgi:hypothetical protein
MPRFPSLGERFVAAPQYSGCVDDTDVFSATKLIFECRKTKLMLFLATAKETPKRAHQT